jgi:hypothetical protein
MPEPRHGVTVDPAAIGKPDWVCGRCLTVGCPRCGRRCSPWNLFRDRNREDVCLDCAHRADREADR